MARADVPPERGFVLTDLVVATDVARSCDRSMALDGRQVVLHDKPTIIA